MEGKPKQHKKPFEENLTKFHFFLFFVGWSEKFCCWVKAPCKSTIESNSVCFTGEIYFLLAKGKLKLHEKKLSATPEESLIYFANFVEFRKTNFWFREVSFSFIFKRLRKQFWSMKIFKYWRCFKRLRSIVCKILPARSSSLHQTIRGLVLKQWKKGSQKYAGMKDQTFNTNVEKVTNWKLLNLDTRPLNSWF